MNTQDGSKQRPKRVDDEWARQRARSARDSHWAMMERMMEHGTLWIDPWNKTRRSEAPDEVRFSLLGFMDWGNWVRRHPDWFSYGAYDDERCASPWNITEAGRRALRERQLYDMEPYESGLVEPGWEAIPLPANDQLT